MTITISREEIEHQLKLTRNHIEDQDLQLEEIRLAGKSDDLAFAGLVQSLKDQRTRLEEELAKWEHLLKAVEA